MNFPLIDPKKIFNILSDISNGNFVYAILWTINPVLNHLFEPFILSTHISADSEIVHSF